MRNQLRGKDVNESEQVNEEVRKHMGGGGESGRGTLQAALCLAFLSYSKYRYLTSVITVMLWWCLIS